jgi:hypothetical protein
LVPDPELEELVLVPPLLLLPKELLSLLEGAGV